MTKLQDTLKLLLKNWETLSLEFNKLKIESRKLDKQKEILLSQLDGLLKTFDILGKRPSGLIIPPELQFKATSSIGDLIETILKERGTMQKAELLVLLHKAGRLDTKNARVVLANALKRDAKERFIVEGGKVSLAEKHDVGEFEPLESFPGY
jgi:hypothetical protein